MNTSERKKRRHHHTVKVLTFTSLANDRYRCNQTGELVTRADILRTVSNYAAGNRTVSVKQGQNPAAKRRGMKHPSKYRAKHK